MCMRVEFHQRKNGLPAACCCSMKASARAVISSSTVSMRFLVRGPVSWILPPAIEWITPRGPKLLLELWIPRVVDAFRLLLCVQVVEVSKELVETVGGREELVEVAQVVLAELVRRV